MIICNSYRHSWVGISLLRRNPLIFIWCQARFQDGWSRANEPRLLPVSSGVSPSPFRSIRTAWGRLAAARDVAPIPALTFPTSCEAQGAGAGSSPPTLAPQNPWGTPGQERGALLLPSPEPPPRYPNLRSLLFPSSHDKRLSGGRGGKIIPPPQGRRDALLTPCSRKAIAAFLVAHFQG